MSMKKVKVNWETDGISPNKFHLPSIVDVPSVIDDEDVTDWLSDNYGFLVNSWEEY